MLVIGAADVMLEGKYHKEFTVDPFIAVPSSENVLVWSGGSL